MILFGTEITWDPKHQKSFEKGGNKNVYVNKDISDVSNFDSILVPRAAFMNGYTWYFIKVYYLQLALILKYLKLLNGR